jgi:hypothetical protein
MARLETALDWRRSVSAHLSSDARLPHRRQGRLKLLVSARPVRRQEREAVHAVLEGHWPLWDTPERIALFARIPLELTRKALEALREEGVAIRDGSIWRAARTISTP